MKRILVTGGFGFLGSHLVDELLATDPDVELSIVDNLSSNAIPPETVTDPRVTAHLGDVRSFLAGAPPFHDEIYHLASVVGPAGILPHAGRIVASVVDDTYAVAAAARRWSARLLDVSTSEVYGGGEDGFCREDMPRLIVAETSVRLEYAVAKLAAETALINQARVQDLDVVIVRPFNICGPRQRSEGGFVLPRFCAQALAGEPLTVFGDGRAVRAFTHARDTAAGLRLAMQYGRAGEVYNIGNAENLTTIYMLARLVIDLAESRSEIEHVDPTTLYGPFYAEAADKYPDPSKSRDELHWRPRKSLTAIVDDTLAYLRAQVSA